MLGVTLWGRAYGIGCKWAVAGCGSATCMHTANEPLNEYFKITDSRRLADHQNQMKPNQTKPNQGRLHQQQQQQPTTTTTATKSSTSFAVNCNCNRSCSSSCSKCNFSLYSEACVKSNQASKMLNVSYSSSAAAAAAATATACCSHSCFVLWQARRRLKSKSQSKLRAGPNKQELQL